MVAILNFSSAFFADIKPVDMEVLLNLDFSLNIEVKFDPNKLWSQLIWLICFEILECAL